MKKHLLTVAFTMLCFTTFSQIKLSEFYVKPSSSGTEYHEYFELYNTGNSPVNLNCYSLVAYFNNNKRTGMYVLNLPDVNVQPKATFVGAAADVFNYESVSGPSSAIADLNWNNLGATASLKRYIKNEAGTDLIIDPIPIANNFNDLFQVTSFYENRKEPRIYGVALFNSGVLVQSFTPVISGHPSDVFPEDVTLPDLVVAPSGGCPGFTVNFAAIALQVLADAFQLGDVKKDGGFHYDFCNGPWINSNDPENNTPSAAASGFHAVLQAVLQNAVSVTADCAAPLKDFTVNVSNVLPPGLAGTQATVNLYADNGVIGVLDGPDLFINNGTIVSIGGGTIVSQIVPSSDVSFLVQVNFPSVCASVLLQVNCTATPVTLKSFNANRKNASVSLIWETAAEQNNKGFNVQRKQGNEWQNIGFVGSKAKDGNSNNDLAYSFNDVNNFNGVSHYRLEQVDIDGKKDFSITRSVGGNGQGGKVIVYPNPGVGRINVAFSDMNIKDLLLSDLNGRMVRQWRNYSQSSMSIDNLQPGIYMLRITDKQSGIQSVEKLVISMP